MISIRQRAQIADKKDQLIRMRDREAAIMLGSDHEEESHH